MQKVFDSNNIGLNVKKMFPAALSKILNNGIAVVDDCFYFKDYASPYSPDLFDKTGNECFRNKFYVDYCTDITDNIEALRLGISFVKCLANKLESYNEPFCIILGYQDDFGVDIRFHKIRMEEATYMEDVDTYSEGCLFLGYVNNKQR
jgi:hypothetical protein